jgi:carboxypeptidase Q
MNTSSYARYSSVGSDISYMIDEGVPGLDLNNANEQYFYFHHSPADVITVLDPQELDMNTALWAVVSYVLADLSVSLPRESSEARVY